MEQELDRSWHIKFYNRYEYLASYYASKISGYGKLGLEKEDIIQDMKLKIWESIPKFIDAWARYREGDYKPSPMKFYLILVLKNKSKNYFKLVEKNMKNVSMSEVNFDYGIESNPDTIVNLKENQVVIDGVDLYQGMNEVERKAFQMRLKGHKLGTINKLYGKKATEDLSKKIREQIEMLRVNHADLKHSMDSKVFHVFEYSDEE